MGWHPLPERRLQHAEWGCMAATQPRSLARQREQALVPGASNEGGDSRARQAIHDLELRLELFSTKSAGQLDAEMTQGSEAAKAGWIRERLVIASEELEQAWVWSRQALDEACERGEFFCLPFLRRSMTLRNRTALVKMQSKNRKCARRSGVKAA